MQVILHLHGGSTIRDAEFTKDAALTWYMWPPALDRLCGSCTSLADVRYVMHLYFSNHTNID
jgi:hypothetical protein